jgi:hypothetical protein
MAMMCRVQGGVEQEIAAPEEQGWSADELEQEHRRRARHGRENQGARHREDAMGASSGQGDPALGEEREGDTAREFGGEAAARASREKEARARAMRVQLGPAGKRMEQRTPTTEKEQSALEKKLGAGRTSWLGIRNRVQWWDFSTGCVTVKISEEKRKQ